MGVGVEWVCCWRGGGGAACGAAGLRWGPGGVPNRRGGALATAGRLRGAFRGRERASLAAAAAARTALRLPRRWRSRGQPGPACPRAAAWPLPSEQLELVSVPFRSPPPAWAHRRRSCSNGVENGHWAAMSYRLSAPRFVLSCL